MFESNMEERAKSLLKRFNPPKYFANNLDIFDIVKEDHRPPHRWFLIGPERSGTTVNIDPMLTNA